MRRRPPRSPLFPYTTPFGSADVPAGQPVRPQVVDDHQENRQGAQGLDLGEEHPVRAPGRRLGCAEREQLMRSEEHTSELQSRQYLVCRLLLEKKKKKIRQTRQNHNVDEKTRTTTHNTVTQG